MSRLYAEAEVMEVLASLDWHEPTEFLQNVPGNRPVLFRGHDILDVEATRDYGRAGQIIHATPIFGIAASISSFRLNKNYKNFPSKSGFLTVYPCRSDQKFYPDETLEFVHQGKLQDIGVPLYEIESFDQGQHFETAIAAGTQPLQTYMFRHDGLGKNMRIGEMTKNHFIYDVLSANAYPPGLTFSEKQAWSAGPRL